MTLLIARRCLNLRWSRRFCNDAELNETGGSWTVSGDPMEGALLALAIKAGGALEPLTREWFSQRCHTI